MLRIQGTDKLAAEFGRDRNQVSRWDHIAGLALVRSDPFLLDKREFFEVLFALVLIHREMPGGADAAEQPPEETKRSAAHEQEHDQHDDHDQQNEIPAAFGG